ncbi:hypothetical protein A0H81_12607 [Grifola frondosa]|uniref:Uncharacterized protein n=1 Tax=Grifola frondosa TaxID=5627 RepID=A0A1C7LRW6_GRIFR|nr:hypothetical protein A0H81_12607 [Grifola frondosa]
MARSIMKLNPLYTALLSAALFTTSCVYVSADLISVPSQAFDALHTLERAALNWVADSIPWGHDALHRPSDELVDERNTDINPPQSLPEHPPLMRPIADLFGAPSDFWERVQTHAGGLWRDGARTSFADGLAQLRVAANKTLAQTKDGVLSAKVVRKAFAVEVEALLQTLQGDIAAPPASGPNLAAALWILEEAIVHLGVQYDVPEEQLRAHLDTLRPHAGSLLAMTEQHPELVEALLISALDMIIPGSGLLRLLFGSFRSALRGPATGSPGLACAQRSLFGAAVESGSWLVRRGGLQVDDGSPGNVLLELIAVIASITNDVEDKWSYSPQIIERIEVEMKLEQKVGVVGA